MNSLLLSLHLPSLRKYNEQQVRTTGERKEFIKQARTDERQGCIDLHIISISSDGTVTISPAGGAE